MDSVQQSIRNVPRKFNTNYNLSVNNVDSLTVISGSIPGGLRIENNNLVGTF